MGELIETTQAITSTIHCGFITMLSLRNSLSKYCTVPRSCRNCMALLTQTHKKLHKIKPLGISNFHICPYKCSLMRPEIALFHKNDHNSCIYFMIINRKQAPRLKLIPKAMEHFVAFSMCICRMSSIFCTSLFSWFHY